MIGTPCVLISTARIRPGSEDDFAAWKGRHDAAIAAFSGFNSSEILPPGEHDDAWTVLVNFDSEEHLLAWQHSSEHAEILAELAPLLLGSDFGEVVQSGSSGADPVGGTATQVIFSRVRPGMENKYREWASRMHQAQAHHPGYRGMYLQPPAAGATHWITILRFATSEQLNAWLAAPERISLLAESRTIVEGEEMLRLATSFPGWVRADPETGKVPPNWKTALLVLLGLYPIVAIELIYLNPRLRELSPAVGIFVGNVLSVAATSFLTMPLLVRSFERWLSSGENRSARAGTYGGVILAILFAVEVGFVTLLFRWHGR